jgi:hypothetical protein
VSQSTGFDKSVESGSTPEIDGVDDIEDGILDVLFIVNTRREKSRKK